MTDKKEYNVIVDGFIYDNHNTLDEAMIDLERVKKGILQNIEIKEEEIDELNDTLNTLTIQEVNTNDN
jgi:hypothetical protein